MLPRIENRNSFAFLNEEIRSATQGRYATTAVNPIFTLPYTELLVAEYLRKQFPAKLNYSVLLPLSREQKGFDLILSRRNGGMSKAVTIQIKGSRTYVGKPAINKNGKRLFRYSNWFNHFKPSIDADFFVLVSLYPPVPSTTKRSAEAWASHFLLFTYVEMVAFLDQAKTRNGLPDKFGFGFDNGSEAFVTRGIAGLPDYSSHLLSQRLSSISGAL